MMRFIRGEAVARIPMRRRAAAIAVAAALAAGSAQAFEIDTGNPDVSLRWDNTFRYNLGVRVEGRDQNIGNYFLADEGTYSFDKNDVVSNRLDILSELDFVWKKTMGFRLSAAAWYDNAYDGKHPVGNPALVVPPLPGFGPFPPLRQALPNGGQLVSYDNGNYSPYVKRHYAGPSGEILDAFVFANFDAGDVPVSVKAGRHTLYWGESLLLGGAVHGISYSQMPLDLQKGFATPGTEVKELFRPLGQVSAQAQLTPELSLAGQVFFEWDSARYPEGGTYLGPADPLFNGPDRQIVPVPSPTRLTLVNAARGDAAEPKQFGDFGVAARWSPQWLDGTLGFYYRRYSDKLPNVFLTGLNTTPIYANGSPPTVVAVNGEYRLVYKDDVDLFGVSLSKQIAGVSVGAEASYRHNTPLFSRLFSNVAGQTFGKGDTPGAVGDTWHALVNAVGIVPKTPLFDMASYQAELTWSQWSKVRAGGQYFNAVGFGGCPTNDKWDGCATKNFVGGAVNFTPTWFQVLPGADLSMPLTWSQGLSGNAATVLGGNERAGTYSVGLGVDFRQQWRFDLKYIDFLGRYRTGTAPFGGGQAVTSQNGLNALLVDRGFINFTVKATF
jgi:hypothetical protein